jgi:HK97 family phage major capsid protein
MNATTEKNQEQDLLFRFATFDRAAMTEAAGKKSLRVAFSSETPVLRSENGQKYYEQLSHNPEDSDLSLLNDGGAFIDEHNWKNQIGSIERAWLDKDRVGRADLSFADTELGRERWMLMSTGHRKDISFGYIQTRQLSETRGADGIPIRRFAWKAFEITSTAVGADHFKTGVGRSTEIKKTNTRSMNNEKTGVEIDYQTADRITANANEFAKDNPHIAAEILAEKTRAISEGLSTRAFAGAVYKMLEANPRKNLMRTVDHEIGMDQGDIQQYSLHRAIRSLVTNNGKLDGFELDVSQQVERKCRQRAEGFFIPMDVVFGGSRRNFLKRDMTVGDFQSGGAAAGTQILPFIELLRNKTVCNRLGSTVLAGLTSDVAIPREVAPAIAYSVPEVGQLPDSNLLLDEIRLSPHRVGVTVTYGKQLVFQSSEDIESLIRADAMDVVALKHDALFLNGTGSSDEPLGLLNTIGLNSVAFLGTPTYAKIIAFETACGVMNADRGRLAYVTTPRAKGNLKQIAVALAGATTVSANALWESEDFGDGSNDGLVNGYRAAASNQIPGDRVLYGNWTDFITAYFGGFDIVLDPYTSAKKAQIVLTINTWIDCAPRHAQSFTTSADGAV